MSSFRSVVSSALFEQEVYLEMVYPFGQGMCHLIGVHLSFALSFFTLAVSSQ